MSVELHIPTVRCDRLTKRYGDLVAVDRLSLTVDRGECVGLLGPNGAGKTTTIEILEGLLTPDAGDVEVLGLRWRTDGTALRQRLGIQLQETRLAENVDWLIPGIVGMNVMSTGMWGIGFSVVQARLRKILKRLVASPMRKRDYLLAQMIARVVFLAPEVAIPVAFGALVLRMPVAGSIAALAVVSLVGGLSFTGLGLLTASRPRTLEAINGMLNLTMLPMWVLSGVFFSTANFPGALQPFIQALPLTALNDALRAVILEGATVGAVGGGLLLLAVWGVVPFLLALRLFRWV